MRRHLRYLTTIFSVAFETQKVLAFFVSSQADLPTLERDREYGREVAQTTPHIQADQSAHRVVSHRGSARSKRAMVASGGG